jgi:hypothetical protein
VPGLKMRMVSSSSIRLLGARNILTKVQSGLLIAFVLWVRLRSCCSMLSFTRPRLAVLGLHLQQKFIGEKKFT